MSERPEGSVACAETGTCRTSRFGAAVFQVWLDARAPASPGRLPARCCTAASICSKNGSPFRCPGWNLAELEPTRKSWGRKFAGHRALSQGAFWVPTSSKTGKPRGAGAAALATWERWKVWGIISAAGPLPTSTRCGASPQAGTLHKGSTTWQKSHLPCSLPLCQGIPRTARMIGKLRPHP